MEHRISLLHVYDDGLGHRIGSGSVVSVSSCGRFGSGLCRSGRCWVESGWVGSSPCRVVVGWGGASAGGGCVAHYKGEY